MNGHILEGTSICVDYWLWTPEKNYTHFLSHLHPDRTYKLNSTFRGNIYTSPFNSWLVKKWFEIPMQQVVSLKLDEPHILSDGNGGYFNATLIDANHCPGSVMFLFEGTFGTILYTGDFRYTPKMLKSPMLKSIIDNQMLEELYLDNSFAAEECKVPSQEEALKQVIDLIKMHPDHYIVIGVKNIGKEEVLIAIAKELQEKVLVSVRRMAILQHLRFPNVFTTKIKDSRIFAKEIDLITGDFLFKLKEEKGPVLTVLLSALHSMISSHQPESKILEDELLGIHRIPYSDHSSHQELVNFVSKVRPVKIHPIICSTREKHATSAQHNGFHRDRDVLELSCVWNFHKIPESILKFCRICKVQGKALPESMDVAEPEVQSKQRPEEVSNDKIGVGYSQTTEDLSNDVREIQSCRLSGDLSLSSSTSLVNNHQTSQLNTVTRNVNTEGKIIEQVSENPRGVSNTEYNKVVKNLEALFADPRQESEGVNEYLSLSQEDLVQILIQPSNVVDSKNSPKENSRDRKLMSKKTHKLEENEDPTSQKSEESDFISLSQEDLTKLPVQPSTSKETTNQSKKCEKRPSTEPVETGEPKMRKIDTNVEEILPERVYSDVNSAYPVFSSFEEVSKYLKQFHLRKVTTLRTDQHSVPNVTKSRVALGFNTSSKSKIHPRDKSERSPESFENFAGISEFNLDSYPLCLVLESRSLDQVSSDSSIPTPLSLGSNISSGKGEFDSRRAREVTSDCDKEDFLTQELIETTVFYQDQLAKRLGGQHPNSHTLMMTNAEVIHENWKRALKAKRQSERDTSDMS